jgi:hypothetical protein
MLSELLPWNASSTRRGRGRSTGRGAVTDAASSWQAFLASPVAPQRAITLPELDGYPTAVIVAPSLIQRGAHPPRQLLQELRLAGDTQPHDDMVRADQFPDCHQSGARNRYPTPVSVMMYSGFSVSDSIFWRSALT